MPDKRGASNEGERTTQIWDHIRISELVPEQGKKIRFLEVSTGSRVGFNWVGRSLSMGEGRECLSDLSLLLDGTRLTA